MMPFPPSTPNSTERARRRSSSSAGSINSFCGSSVSLAESTVSSRSESYSDAGGEGWSFTDFPTTGVGVGVGGSGGLQTSVRILQECRLSLIHIPLHLYPHFVQAILSLILPCVSPSDTIAAAAGAAPWDRRGGGATAEDDYDTYGSEDEYEPPTGIPSYHRQYHQRSIPTPPPRCPAVKEFVNISVTPVECSIVCSTASVERFFAPIIKSLEAGVRGEVKVSEDEFVAIQVDGEGLDAGQRVLDLTSPLALAGVSIFFITTYFSDYILVPSRLRPKVTKALQQRGFVFERHSSAYTASTNHHHNNPYSYGVAPPSPPPTTSIAELHQKTFETLRSQSILPIVNHKTKLVLCAGRRSPSSTDRGLYLGLVQCLISNPQYFSLTLTDAEPPSLLVQKDMLGLFGGTGGRGNGEGGDVLLGRKDDVKIPILLDLRGLPIDSTGIVCGVAGRLVGGDKGGVGGEGGIEMSYLSTARAGTVIVAEEDLAEAIAALGM